MKISESKYIEKLTKKEDLVIGGYQRRECFEDPKREEGEGKPNQGNQLQFDFGFILN